MAAAQQRLVNQCFFFQNNFCHVVVSSQYGDHPKFKNKSQIWLNTTRDGNFF
jgi:hypothetical protein